jgi:cytochrome c-type biogenesis protein CcmH/NrfG
MSEEEDRTPSVGGDSDRWHLDDEREFLRRSLEDAEREHAAGDLSDQDLAALVKRDQARLDEVEAALERLGPAAAPEEAASDEAPSRRGSPWRLVGIVGCCVLIVVGVVILVVHATQTRLPGQASSGSITQSQAQLIEQQLGEAETFRDADQTLAALQLYNKVLAEDPRDPDALANAGWLQWKSGFADHAAKVTKKGRNQVLEAVKVAPANYEARLYLGVIYVNQDHNAAAAQTQFARFLADDPPPAVVHDEASLIAGVYQSLGLAVPAALTTSSTTTSAP